MLSFNNSTNNDLDSNYYGLGNDEVGEDEDENDDTIIGITETIHNINIQEELNFEEIQHPAKSS